MRKTVIGATLLLGLAIYVHPAESHPTVVGNALYTDGGILSSAGIYTDGGVSIGSPATVIVSSVSGSATIDVGSIAAGACIDSTMALTGVAANDPLACSFPIALEANLSASCWVTAANTVTFRVCNIQLVAAIDPASGTYAARSLR